MPSKIGTDTNFNVFHLIRSRIELGTYRCAGGHANQSADGTVHWADKYIRFVFLLITSSVQNSGKLYKNHRRSQLIQNRLDSSAEIRLICRNESSTSDKRKRASSNEGDRIGIPPEQSNSVHGIDSTRPIARAR